MPENHPLVVISHLFAEAFDANGIICGRFEMKITKRLARNSSTGVLEYPLRAIGKYMLVESPSSGPTTRALRTTL